MVFVCILLIRVLFQRVGHLVISVGGQNHSCCLPSFICSFSFSFGTVTKVGCQMACTFCATGTMGLKGDLTAGEILEQVLHASRVSPIRNVVFMGEMRYVHR